MGKVLEYKKNYPVREIIKKNRKLDHKKIAATFRKDCLNKNCDGVLKGFKQYCLKYNVQDDGKFLRHFIQFHLSKRFKELSNTGMDQPFIRQLAKLISKMLEASPDERLTCEEILQGDRLVKGKYNIFEGMNENYKKDKIKKLMQLADGNLNSTKPNDQQNTTKNEKFSDKHITKYCCKALFKLDPNCDCIMRIAPVEHQEMINQSDEVFRSCNSTILAEFNEFNVMDNESDDWIAMEQFRRVMDDMYMFIDDLIIDDVIIDDMIIDDEIGGRYFHDEDFLE